MISKRIASVGIVLVALFALSAPAMAEQIAEIAKFQGEAYIQPAAGGPQVPIDRVGQPLNNEDTVVVKKGGEVQLVYNDGALTTVSPNTEVKVTQKEEESSLWFIKKKRLTRRLKTLFGKIAHQSGSDIKYHIAETPTAVAAIRGSSFTLVVVKVTDPNTGATSFKSIIAPAPNTNLAMEGVSGTDLAVTSQESQAEMVEAILAAAGFDSDNVEVVATVTVETPPTVPGQGANPDTTGTGTLTEESQQKQLEKQISDAIKEQAPDEEGIPGNLASNSAVGVAIAAGLVDPDELPQGPGDSVIILPPISPSL